MRLFGKSQWSPNDQIARCRSSQLEGDFFRNGASFVHLVLPEEIRELDFMFKEEQAKEKDKPIKKDKKKKE